MFIPGSIISTLTFPGVIIHEMSHRFFCDIEKIPVYDVCYFKAGNPAGYLIHAPTTKLRSSLLISIGPLIINTFVCSILTLSATFPLTILKVENSSFVFALLFWIGISAGMHAFPSNADIDNFIATVKNTQEGGGLLFLAKVFSYILKTANALRFFWFDLLYAFGISQILPSLISLFILR
jgi:hypothetical protein